MMFEVIKDILLPYKSLVFIVAGAAFVIGLSVAIRYHRSKRVRQVFLVCFFSCLLLTSLAGQHVLPFTQWHKFSTTGDTDPSYYRVQLITESGERMPIDKGAIEGMGWRKLASSMLFDYSKHQQLTSAKEVVEESNQHRNETLRDDSPEPLSLPSFPSHGFGSTDWNRSVLREEGSFVGMAVVRVDLTISSDGKGIENRTTTTFYRWTESEGVTNNSQPNSAAGVV